MPTPKKSTVKSSAAKKTAVGEPVALPKEKPAKAAKPAAKVEDKPQGMTSVVAQIDVGFGNHLTIRGFGAGLSWGKSQPMKWENGAWTWQTTQASEDFEFKTLLNDRVWQQGLNLKAKAGQKTVFRPHF